MVFHSLKNPVGRYDRSGIEAVHRDEPVNDRFGKYKIDELDASRVAKHLVLFRPTAQVVEQLMARARLAIPGLAATADVQRVVRHNPDCLFAVARKSKFNPDAPTGEGFFAMLPLNALGLQLLALDALNTRSPDVRFIAKPGERPAGIYMWCVLAPGALAAGWRSLWNKLLHPNIPALPCIIVPSPKPERPLTRCSASSSAQPSVV